MTNSSQGVTASLTLSAFGQTIASTGSSTSAYQFGATSGYQSKGDAALTLVGCRCYDAQVGRFITRDTYLDQKPYAYCDGDPVNAVDPTGHAWRSGVNIAEDIAIGAGVAIIVVIASPVIAAGAGAALIATAIAISVAGGAKGAGAVAANNYSWDRAGETWDNNDMASTVETAAITGGLTAGVARGYGVATALSSADSAAAAGAGTGAEE